MRTPSVVRRRAASLPCILAACSVLAGSCADDGSRTTSVPVTRPVKRPKFVERPCDVEVPTGSTVTCGTVTVPEDRERPDGRSVALAVVRIHATAATPKVDPVVYLHGGPGVAVLPHGIAGLARSPFLAERDLIVFDQRGSGLSTPSLNCPERDSAFIDTLATRKPFAEDVELFDKAVADCHDRLAATGVSLDRYNTVETSADLADLRVAMGIDSWNLWGASYGTRLALETMRSHPEGIRSVILDSVYPPSAGEVDDPIRSGERAFAALASGCTADPTCGRAIPDLAKLVDQLYGRLEKTPIVFTYKPQQGEPKELQIGGQDALGGLFTAMYDTDLIPLLPKIINDLAQGDTTIVPEIANRAIPFVNDTSEGAMFSFECADNDTRIDPAGAERLRRDPGRSALAVLTGAFAFCGEWPVTPLPNSFADTVRSDIPTLVVAGEYDPITPPDWSRNTAQDLGQAIFALVPRAGHAPMFDNECTAGLATRFLADLTDVDRGCIDRMTPRPFVI